MTQTVVLRLTGNEATQFRQRAALVFVFAFGLAGRAQEWKQIGPDPIAGESFSNLPNATSSGVVDGIALDPSGSKISTIYIATAAGGVWKTTDGGANWSSKNRSMDVLYMGAIALDPSDPTKVYAANGGPYCCAVGGGIYSSTDGAEDWTLINPQGIFTANPVNAIVLPKSGTLLAATPTAFTNPSTAETISATTTPTTTTDSRSRL